LVLGAKVKYIIYKSTFKKDIGLDLSMVTDGTKFLDKTSIDGKIYMADYPSTDPLDLKFKYYSISKLNDTSYLELGFIDNTLNNKMESVISNNKNSKTEIKLYTVTKFDNYYQYYILGKKEHIKVKQDLLGSTKQIPIDKPTDDYIINSVKKNSSIHFLNNNIHTTYVNIFDEDIKKILGFSNIVMKIDIDVSEKIEFLTHYKNIFILSLIVISLLLLYLFMFIKSKFTNPIEEILHSLENSKRVDQMSILSLNNELSEISKKYNILFDTLTLEINKNQVLLTENKRFIADTIHQIRTPLTNIMMNGEMIKKFQNDDNLSHFVDQIDASINMLSNSYEDLAYIMSYDTMKYQSNKIQICYLLKKRIRFFTTISKVNNKEILSNIESNLNININEIECERIIDNNISNAIKYATQNEQMTINLFRKNSNIVLQFKSYGEPIKNKSKVFDKNYRENESKRGLGLGLNMVKNICEKYNVSYSVSYEDGQNIFTYCFEST
jgi:signal transduction histidine kinase